MGIVILGDMMLGRHMSPIIEQHGINKIFNGLKSVIENNELIANLESPLINEMIFTNTKDSFYKLFAKDNIATMLSDNGIKAVSLGNNHIFDCGVEGLLNTQAVLEKNAIQYFGAGINKDQAIKPAIIRLKNYTIGLLGFSFSNLAKDDKPGVAHLYDNTVDIAIKRLKGKVDFIIIMPHSGIELYEYPLLRDQKIYRRMIELGADLVIGSQSHCVQAMEIYLGKCIYYSTGDLLFDHFHDDTWIDFNSEISHVNKFALKPNRLLPFYSIMIIIDIVDGRLIVNHVPIINCFGFQPKLLELSEKEKWEKYFAILNDKLQNDLIIKQERSQIEKILVKDLKSRGVITHG